MNKFLFLTLTFLLLSLPLLAGDYGNKVNFFEGTYEEALQLAATENKGIMIDFNTEWCIWCRNLEMRVFTNDDFANFVNANLINMKVDAEKGDGVALAEMFEARGFPTVIFLNSEGKQLGRVAGYMPANEYLKFTKELVIEGLTKDYLKSEIDKGSIEQKILYYYAERLYSDREQEEALEYYIQVANGDSDYRTDAEFMVAIINEEYEKMDELASMYPHKELVRDVRITQLNKAFETEDEQLISKTITDVESQFPDDEFVKFYIGQHYLGKASKVVRDSSATNEDRLAMFPNTDKAEPYLKGMIFEAGVNYVRSELYYQLKEYLLANEYIDKALSLWSYRKMYVDQKAKIQEALQ